MKNVEYRAFTSNKIIYRHRFSLVDETNRKYVGEHYHDVCEILFLKQGDMLYTVEGEEYDIKKNSLILTRAGNSHSIKLNSETYERYNILFDESILSSEVFEMLEKSETVISLEGNNFVEKLFRRIDFYCEHFSEGILKIMIKNAIEEILCNAFLTENMLYFDNPVMKNIIEYINNNLTNQLDLNLICNEFFISKSYLHKQFVKYLNTSPKKYIISKRLMKAHHAIKLGGKPTEVFSECGFSDYSNFYREYKSHFGISPSEKRGRGKDNVILS